MAISKVVYGSNTLVDLTSDTVNAGNMLEGTTAHKANGELATGNITRKGEETYTPGTSNQTIAPGQYLSGVQLIQGDADLVASNIKNGVSIFNVEGSYAPQVVRSGNSEPSSGLGSNGDVYFVVEG